MKRGGSEQGKGKGSDSCLKRHERPIAAAARRMGWGEYEVYSVIKVLIAVSPCVSRSSKVGECCR